MIENIEQAAKIQTQLWGKICEDGLPKRVDQGRKGHLPFGQTLDGLPDTSINVLGEFAPRVLLVTHPDNPFTLIPEQIGIAGGWCALRTNDVQMLSTKGSIMDPETSSIATVSSVDQAAAWIRRSVAFDQIIESVGAVNGSEYAVISEGKLWTQRMHQKLGQIFNRSLTPTEKTQIAESIDTAERTRGEMTKRYIQFVTKNDSIAFTRISDEDIWEDLQKAQEEMFARAGLTLPELERRFPEDAATIRTSANVWAMYSQPYFDMLRQKGLVKSATIFIAEPSFHTYADTRPGNEVVSRIYQNTGVYLDKGGFNPDTGFISFIECVTTKGASTRKHMPIGEVPNVVNWRQMLKDGILQPEKNTVLNPKENNLFVWGVNLLPFGETRKKLLELLAIQEYFQAEKAKIGATFTPAQLKNDSTNRQTLSDRTAALKLECFKRIVAVNANIAQDISVLCRDLTQGLESAYE